MSTFLDRPELTQSSHRYIVQAVAFSSGQSNKPLLLASLYRQSADDQKSDLAGDPMSREDGE
jgi:hypothetical protein